jgi:exosortase B
MASSASTISPTGNPTQAHINMPALALLALGFLVLFIPTYVSLSSLVWSTDEQSHGPMVLGSCVYLLWTLKDKFLELKATPAPVSGLSILCLGLVFYVIGRSQQVIEAEGFSQIPILLGCLLLLFGWKGVRLAWFPLFFMLFMVPLPGALVSALTLPLKQAVSVVAEQVLFWLDYPIARTGVMLTIGQYQLLVADACSGLNSLFTLEALGLLYMNVMHYQSKTRNIALALMIVPISFVSNVTRVITLVLITYYLGDEVGQGFAHGFAGILLFAVALVLTYAFDRLLAARFDKEGGLRG